MNNNDNNNNAEMENLNYPATEKIKSKEDDVPTRKIFIDHVICNETKFNDLEVRDHVYTVVAAVSFRFAFEILDFCGGVLDIFWNFYYVYVHKTYMEVWGMILHSFWFCDREKEGQNYM